MEFTTGLMSLDTALNEMLSRVTPLTAQETLPLVQCFGRILASDVVSPLDVPGFDNSAMGRLRGAFSRYCLRATAARCR